MKAIKAARQIILSRPNDPEAIALADLVLALENESALSLSQLYELDSEHFELALRILSDWRIDRYYMGKARLFDLSWQHRELRTGPASEQ